jgi:uncharacterized protein
MAFAELANEKYVSVTTFRRDGTPVSTPVWVVGEDGRLLVHTAAASWKVKRIRRDPHVRVTPCSATGKPRGEAVDAEATLLPETAAVEELLAKKYGLTYKLVSGVNAVIRFVRRRSPVPSVTISIAPIR